MVSSIISTPAGAGALGVDPRYARSGAPQQAPANESNVRGDSVQIGDAALWASARASVASGLGQVGDALAVGRDIYAQLNTIADLAETGGDDAASQLSAALDAISQRVSGALSGGNVLVGGGAISVQAEPGAPDVVVQGLDLQLKDTPGASDVLSLGRNATLDDPAALAAAVQRSMDALQGGMENLLDAARALGAHQGFLDAAGAAAGVNPDLDADSARLAALQVRQGLAATNMGITSADPQAVLALFRS